jgi:UDP-glucuronate decarboxylase
MGDLIRKRVLVAGGAGFLGANLCERLVRDGHRVICLDNFLTGRRDNLHHLPPASVEVIRHDITEPLPPDLRVDEIYNLACAASPPHYQADPLHTLLTSTRGSQVLLELARRCGARIFQSSTSEVYGNPQVHPQPESYWGHVNANGPRACYDEGKRCAETLFFDWQRTYGTEIKVGRIFNTYGPFMHPADGRVVSNFIVQALRNEPITIYGDGSQTRSFCYVDDLIDLMVRFMESDPGFVGPLNMGNPDERNVLEVAELILELTGSRSRLVTRDLPVDDPLRRCPDIAIARERLGWQPTTPLRDGLATTIAYFEERLGRATDKQGRMAFTDLPRSKPSRVGEGL